MLGSGATVWSAWYKGLGAHEGGVALARSQDGTKVFVVGEDTVIAYSASSGAQRWAKPYNGPASTIAVRAGKVFVTGGYSDYLTIAYDASSGLQLWARRYNGPAKGLDGASALALSADGSRVFVTGTSDGGSTTHYDYGTIGYDAATGTQLWAKRYNGSGYGDDAAKSLAVSGDGTKVFVTGQSYGGPTTEDDYATVAYDSATGAKQWVARYNGIKGGYDSGNAVAAAPKGSKAFVSGISGCSSNYYRGYGTVAYDGSTGARLWTACYTDSTGTSEAHDLAVSPDGSRVFVAGDSYDENTSYDFATVAYDTGNGSQLWARRWQAETSDEASAIAVNPAGTKVYVAGGTRVEAALVAYGASAGSQLWDLTYLGPGNQDRFNDVGVSADGTKVFATGVDGVDDIITFAYQG